MQEWVKKVQLSATKPEVLRVQTFLVTIQSHSDP